VFDKKFNYAKLKLMMNKESLATQLERLLSQREEDFQCWRAAARGEKSVTIGIGGAATHVMVSHSPNIYKELVASHDLAIADLKRQLNGGGIQVVDASHLLRR
jgi:hypothetical protein